jgi:hypothetical protein
MSNLASSSETAGNAQLHAKEVGGRWRLGVAQESRLGDVEGAVDVPTAVQTVVGIEAVIP